MATDMCVWACEKCGEQVGEAWRIRSGGSGLEKIIVCEPCGQRYYKSSYRGWGGVYRGDCVGCGLPVVDVGGTPRVRMYCSWYCERCDQPRVRRARRAAKRAAAVRTCEVCMATITGTRSDARYCSGVCRQAAYRERKARVPGNAAR